VDIVVGAINLPLHNLKSKAAGEGARPTRA
jgi:hypothetical protein